MGFLKKSIDNNKGTSVSFTFDPPAGVPGRFIKLPLPGNSFDHRSLVCHMGSDCLIRGVYITLRNGFEDEDRTLFYFSTINFNMNSSGDMKPSFKITLSLTAGDNVTKNSEQYAPEKIGQLIQHLITLYAPKIGGNQLVLQTEYCNELFEIEETVFTMTCPDESGDFKQNYWIETT